VTSDHLPEGWTLERVVEVGQLAAGASLLDLDQIRVTNVGGPDGDERMSPSVAIDTGAGLCLCLDSDGYWYMAQLADGIVACWGSYGSDLADALRAL